MIWLERRGMVILILAGILLASCGQQPGPTASAPPLATNTASNQSSGASSSTDLVCPDVSQPISGAIAFGGDNNLWAINPDGSNLTQLTALPTTQWSQNPAWSHDGQTLAYTLNSQNSDPDISWLPISVICGMDRSTGKGRVLARSDTTTSVSEPSWSSDGNELLVTWTQHQFDQNKQYLGSSTEIARYNIATKELAPVVKNSSSPALSPDGQKLAYIYSDPELFDVSLMMGASNGENAKKITAPGITFGTITAPTWSNDNQHLVFSTSGGPVSNAESPSLGQTLFDRLLGVQAAQAHGLPADLWIVDADGANPRQLTRKGLDDPRAAWSPDGKQLAYVIYSGGIRLLDIASGEVTDLTDKGNSGGITWAPK